MQYWDKLTAERQQRGREAEKKGWTQVVHCVGSTQCREQGSGKSGAGSLLVPLSSSHVKPPPLPVSLPRWSRPLHSQLCPAMMWKKELGKGVMSQKGGEWGSKHRNTAEENVTGRKGASVYLGQE